MLLIKNGKILTMAGKTIEKGSILIEKGKIKAIDTSIDIPTSDDNIIIDATDLWVLPGLIEAHCHIGISGEKVGPAGEDSNETTIPITPHIRALDGVNPMDSAFHNAIQAGITSVMVGPGSSNVVGGQFLFMKTQGRDIDKMKILEPAAMKVAFGENPKHSYKDLNKEPSSRMTIAAMLREELFKAVQYRKKKLKAKQNGEE